MAHSEIVANPFEPNFVMVKLESRDLDHKQVEQFFHQICNLEGQNYNIYNTQTLEDENTWNLSLEAKDYFGQFQLFFRPLDHQFVYFKLLSNANG